MPHHSNLLIRDYAREIAELLNDIDEEGADLFERGRKFGLAQAAGVLLQEARAFGANLNELGLDVLAERKDVGLH